MIRADTFIQQCEAYNFTFCSGTPCSYLAPLINKAVDAPGIEYIPAVNEGDAVALACGASIAGRRPLVMFQNSGLGNAVNALTSLVHPYRFPMLIVISLRGEPGSNKIEPQHELMGESTVPLLECLGLRWAYLPEKEEAIAPLFKEIDAHCTASDRPFVLIMRHGTVAPYTLAEKTSPPRKAPAKPQTVHITPNPSWQRPGRTETLKTFLRNKQSEDIVISTTGKSSRELYTLEDSADHFYMVGSMGCATPLGLGLALNLPSHRVIVLDGDGALLMRMGNLATAGVFAPPNFLHIVLDNEAHDSTGGQPTFSGEIDFATMARACGYAEAHDIDSLERLEAVLQQSPHVTGPVFIRMRIQKGSPAGLGRPKIAPWEMKERLMQHIETALEERRSA